MHLSASSKAQPHNRVLFVDDEDSIRATLPLVLQKRGFEVTVASNVPTALQQIERQTFDALLTDLHINSAGDGYLLVRSMRKVNPRCATIILTGYPDIPSAVEAIHEHVDDYLVKPTSIDTLTASLKTHIKAHRPKARILLVSFDETLLRTRHMLLEQVGYEVVSAMGLEASIESASTYSS